MSDLYLDNEKTVAEGETNIEIWDCTMYFFSRYH